MEKVRESAGKVDGGGDVDVEKSPAVKLLGF